MKWPFSSKPFLSDEPFRIHMDHPSAAELFGLHLGRLIGNKHDPSAPIVILCIGTDRSTGDSLGPLVGSRLKDIGHPMIKVYGTLDQPVHAVNLNETILEIRRDYPSSFIIAVDACLGRTESIGFINLKAGPLQPGTGVNKTLPEVGDLHIVGIVNVGGFMEYLVLQNTRLSVVMKMAEIISTSLNNELLQRFPAFSTVHVSAALETTIPNGE
ncbi:MAG TPA: spore protease YyaC [Bacillota bacterium]|nr:spore protease YyaC [Bacillota bacterium]